MSKEHMEMKMEMMKMMEERLNAMSDKELRSFIKGYLMGEEKAFKHLSAMTGGCGCGGGKCPGCGQANCTCGKEGGEQ
jgi:hypothetical protein